MFRKIHEIRPGHPTLVGNKADLTDNISISETQARAFFEQNFTPQKCGLFFTSAKVSFFLRENQFLVFFSTTVIGSPDLIFAW